MCAIFQEVDQLLDNRPMARLLLARKAPIERAREHILAHVNVPRRHQIVERVQIGVEADVLECAGDAQLRHPVGAGQVMFALKEQLALLRPVEAADAVEHRSLARAVGADNGANLTCMYVEVDLVEDGSTPKREGDALNL